MENAYFENHTVGAVTDPVTGVVRLQVGGANVLAAARVVTEDRIGRDFVTVTASRNVKAQRCKLYGFEVISGASITVSLTDNADSGGLAVATYAGLNAGDRIPFPAGLDFYDGLYATFTGTATVQFEVI